jgi:hypothetical protein
MLFRLKHDYEGKRPEIQPLKTRRLQDFGLKEKDLEAILFDNLNRVIRQNELLPIAHSRAWREEADLYALDAQGALYIFELKAWESTRENLLQVMRYAQLASKYDYRYLDSLWKKTWNTDVDLDSAHQDNFELDAKLERETFNNDQKLIVMTNGLDADTREAVQYWKSKGVQIFPWIYRLYEMNDEAFIAFDAFGAADDPYEDLGSNAHLVNTNEKDAGSTEYMLQRGRVSAWLAPWKYTMEYIKKNDIVFLYRNQSGIVAFGTAKSNYKIDQGGDEYYVPLEPLHRVNPPITASELRDAAGYHVPLLRTYTSLREGAAEHLRKLARERRADR